MSSLDFREILQNQVDARNSREIEATLPLFKLYQFHLQEHLKFSDVKEENRRLALTVAQLKEENNVLRVKGEEGDRHASDLLRLRAAFQEKETHISLLKKDLDECSKERQVLFDEHKSLREENAVLRTGSGKGFVDLVRENESLKSRLNNLERLLNGGKKSTGTPLAPAEGPRHVEVAASREQRLKPSPVAEEGAQSSPMRPEVKLAVSTSPSPTEEETVERFGETDKFYYPRLSAPRYNCFMNTSPHQGNHLYCISPLDRDSNRFATCGGDRKIRTWSVYDADSKSGGVALETRFDFPLKNNGLPLCLFYNQKHLFCGCDDGAIYAVDPSSSLKSPFSVSNPFKNQTAGRDNSKVIHLSASSSSKHCYSAQGDRVIKVWDCKKGVCLKDIQCKSFITGLELDTNNGDGEGDGGDSVIYSTHDNGLLCVWDKRTCVCSSETRSRHDSGIVSFVKGNGGPRYFVRRSSGSGTSPSFSNAIFTLHKNAAICGRDIRKLSDPFLYYKPSALQTGTKPMRFSAVEDEGNDLLFSVGSAGGETLILSYRKMSSDPNDPGAVLNTLTTKPSSLTVFDTTWVSTDPASNTSNILCGLTEDRKLVGWKMFS
ncbi:hypothetical protein ADEAN_000658500 [Angomonas deanei]|uniref:Guanine nucleotide-binding protein subunit beta-like protein n=1 Tax=Angomonas deanei TaxID=59799 RepID=A0A7G2CLG4_9TRYP|nr:hypothetical protein ADEAN_000658500 [Angomonas deanei]